MRFAVSVRQARLCIAACTLLWASRAPAGEPDARERSVALFKEGVTAGKAGDYARAEAAFRTSHALRPSGSTLRNWALTEMHLGKMVEALGHLKVALTSPELTAEQRSIVQQNFDDAYRATGHLAVRTTEGARVAVDGVVERESGGFRFTTVTLRPVVIIHHDMEYELALRLLEKAERVCLVSRSLSSQITLEPKVLVEKPVAV